MNWRLSALDNIAIMSNSDSHSPERIGREANIFDTELSYEGIMNALRKNDPKSFIATIEYFPEEGMYHFDGHRKCGVSYSPEETLKKRGICAAGKIRISPMRSVTRSVSLFVLKMMRRLERSAKLYSAQVPVLQFLHTLLLVQVLEVRALLTVELTVPLSVLK